MSASRRRARAPGVLLRCRCPARCGSDDTAVRRTADRGVPDPASAGELIVYVEDAATPRARRGPTNRSLSSASTAPARSCCAGTPVAVSQQRRRELRAHVHQRLGRKPGVRGALSFGWHRGSARGLGERGWASVVEGPCRRAVGSPRGEAARRLRGRGCGLVLAECAFGAGVPWQGLRHRLRVGQGLQGQRARDELPLGP